MLIFTLILLFIIAVKGYPSSTKLMNNQRQQVVSNEMSLGISPRAKRNFNNTYDTYERVIDPDIDDIYLKRKAAIDRYYGRQREIMAAFRNNSSTSIPTTLPLDQTPTVPPGYRYYGNCLDSEKTRLLYQHNLGLGLKGPSQFDVNFQVNLDGPVVIKCIEAFPYDNTEGIITWLSGGPGRNYVKLNMKPSNNKGVAFMIKIWGA